MKYNEKELAYQNLIQRVREDYLSRSGPLKWFDCGEINLWALWQGRGHLDARILLVGQDWGCPWDPLFLKRLNRIYAKEIFYSEESDSITNQNLVHLFRLLGYEIAGDDGKNRDLFFTNFVLGYRTGQISGGFQRRWVLEDAPYFYSLTEIIQPTIILCLGRSTFEGVLTAFDYRLSPPIRQYNQFISSQRNPVTISSPWRRPLHIFALAHCGALGTMNRNRGRKDLPDPLALQREDWTKILSYLPENPE